MTEEEVFDAVEPMTPGTTEIKQQDSAQELIAHGAVMQRQQTQYVTAVQVLKPRDTTLVKKKVESDIELDPESAFYHWEVWDKRKKQMVPIEGITIGTAMSVARNYGNCAVDTYCDETPTHYLFSSVFLDLETGFTFKRMFRQRKGQIISKIMDQDRSQDIAFQIGQSKSIRNVIRAAIPAGLATGSIKYAKKIQEKEIGAEGIQASKSKCVDAFHKMGVTIEMLGEYTEISDPDKWSTSVVATLRSTYIAITNNEVRIEEVFPNFKKGKPKVSGSKDSLDPGKKDTDDSKTKKKEKEEKPAEEEKEDAPSGQLL